MDDRQAAIKYPCDQCRRRKIRCNYLSPCDRCQSHGLACTSTAPRKKRGRKPGSGAVVEQLRKETNRNDDNQMNMSASPSTAYNASVEVLPQTASAVQNWAAPTSTPDPGLAVGSHFADSPESPSVLSRVGSRPISTGDVAANGTLPTNDTFFSFDDFAQCVLHPSSTPWHSNLSSISEADWSPFSQHDGQYATPGVLSSPVASTNTPHIISSVAAETPTSGFEYNDIISRAVNLFFQHMYPTYPILIEAQVRSWSSGVSQPGRSDACMLWALCAATLLHVDSWSSLSFEQRMSMAKHYIARCTESRSSGTFLESPVFGDVVCSLFIAIAYFELRSRTTSWVYVREAITLAIASGLQQAETNVLLSNEERIQQQRCYALLFVTERGASILDNFPVSMLSSPSLPEGMLPNETAETLLGLRRLCDLFSLLDLNFVRLWNDMPLSSDENPGHIEFATLQERLRQRLDLRGISDVQRADILITQQWLRLVFWQAELRQGLVSTSSTDSAFTYEYPIEIASSLCDAVKSLPPVAIQVHGLGIFKKQFEIAYSLLDALTFSKSPYNTSASYETLRYLLFSLSASPTSQQIYVKTLEKKIGGEQKYRHMTNVELLRLDGHRRPSQPAVRAR